MEMTLQGFSSLHVLSATTITSTLYILILFSLCVLEERLVYVFQVDCGTIDAL